MSLVENWISQLDNIDSLEQLMAEKEKTNKKAKVVIFVDHKTTDVVSMAKRFVQGRNVDQDQDLR